MMLGFAETHNLNIHGYKTNDDVVRLVKKQLLRKKFEQTPPVTLSQFLKPADDAESRSP